MRLEIDPDLVADYGKAGGKNAALKQAAAEQHYGRLVVDSDIIDADDIGLLLKCAKADPKHQESRDDRRRIRVLKSLLELKTGGSKPLTNLQAMSEALRQYLLPFKHHWVFNEENGWTVPWYVQGINFHAHVSRRDGASTPAHITINMVARARGAKVSLGKTIWREDLGRGITPEALLGDLGLIPENADLLEQYEQDVKKYHIVAEQTGEQFLATGRGLAATESSWRRERVEFDTVDQPSRVVMDDAEGRGRNSRRDEDDESVVACSQSLWVKAKNNDDRDVADEEGDVVLAPLHPLACVFSMKTHEFVVTHVANLEPYQYNPALGEKLVLPAGHKELIDVLIGASGKMAQDIVRGKAGGVIILCSGVPGTGKTLTAEVYSEVAGRPLYTVQCSQLGINPEELEKELATVLERAERWKAILLIDEADVYIHDRGGDVQQNAIVGVFLRMLEYYSGVLFLTTNRETVVDDAIRSRCIAHVHYGVPVDKADKVRLWNILGEQYGLKLSPGMVTSLVTEFPNVAGRTVKQLCRLAASMAATRKVDLPLFRWLAKYQDAEGEEAAP